MSSLSTRREQSLMHWSLLEQVSRKARCDISQLLLLRRGSSRVLHTRPTFQSSGYRHTITDSHHIHFLPLHYVSNTFHSRYLSPRRIATYFTLSALFTIRSTTFCLFPFDPSVNCVIKTSKSSTVNTHTIWSRSRHRSSMTGRVVQVYPSKINGLAQLGTSSTPSRAPHFPSILSISSHQINL